MEKRGLCISCVEFVGCIFSKNPTVWQCEEFSCGNTAVKPKQAKQVICVGETTEAE